jgi:hypothetical protein
MSSQIRERFGSPRTVRCRYTCTIEVLDPFMVWRYSFVMKMRFSLRSHLADDIMRNTRCSQKYVPVPSPRFGKGGNVSAAAIDVTASSLALPPTMFQRHRSPRGAYFARHSTALTCYSIRIGVGKLVEMFIGDARVGEVLSELPESVELDEALDIAEYEYNRFLRPLPTAARSVCTGGFGGFRNPGFGRLSSFIRRLRRVRRAISFARLA